MKRWFWVLFISVSLWSFDFQGRHFVASYYECDTEALTDRKMLKQVMIQAAENAGAQVLNHCSYDFEGNGLTMVILLSESHASIHTYPEHGACFVDLFTCGDTCDNEQFHHVLAKYLKPNHFSGDILHRK